MPVPSNRAKNHKTCARRHHRRRKADSAEAAVTQTDEAAQSEDATEVDGTQFWITTEGSEVAARVSEVLFGIDTEGVGRTEDVTGSVTLIDTTMTEAEFTVDVASMKRTTVEEMASSEAALWKHKHFQRRHSHSPAQSTLASPRSRAQH